MNEQCQVRTQTITYSKSMSQYLKGRFTHSMPFPCHDVPLRVYIASFPFDLHSATLSDSHLPSHAHAMLRPCRSSQGHGTARPSRDVLWATFRLLPATTRSSKNIVIGSIPITDTGGQREKIQPWSWTRKRVKLLD